MLKDQPDFASRGFWIALAIVLVVFAFLMWDGRPRGLRDARLAEAVSNVRGIKFRMDSFAMDNNGVYPNGETAVKYACPNDGSSNALFRQLFAGGYTDNEVIFWIKKSKICAVSRPDDVTTKGGAYAPGETLQAGDNGWAYVLDQEITDSPERPLVFASPPSGAGLVFDPELWQNKVVVLCIDGSVRPWRLNARKRLMDGDNQELLTTDSAVWGEGVKGVRIAYPAWRRK